MQSRGKTRADKSRLVLANFYLIEKIVAHKPKSIIMKSKVNANSFQNPIKIHSDAMFHATSLAAKERGSLKSHRL